MSSSTAGKNGNGGGTGGGPSIRLNLGGSRSSTPPNNGPVSSSAAAASSSAAPSTTADTSQPPKPKKRRFEPPELRPNEAHTDNLELLHQKTALSFFLHRTSPTADSTWFAQGVTSLYVRLLDPNANHGTEKSTTDSSSSITTTTSGAVPLQLALHLRGTCHVTSVQVETMKEHQNADPTEASLPSPLLVPLKTTFRHLDPLERVLLKPATSYTMDDVIQLAAAEKPSAKPSDRRHQADSQALRNATGMTNALRAASIASNLGELRITALEEPFSPATAAREETTTLAESTTNSSQKKNIEESWKQDLGLPIASGDVPLRLAQQLALRSTTRRTNRMNLVAANLADESKKRAIKITVRYQIELGSSTGSLATHLGGIHALSTNGTPHVYTTTGTVGDHEGTRSWVPTLDSASTDHRASHEITIRVTAPMKDGLSVVGFGEDFGVQETLLHDQMHMKMDGGADNTVTERVEGLEREVGKDTVEWIRECLCLAKSNVSSTTETTAQVPHVIPPESSSFSSTNITLIDSILATNVWSSCSWLPISPRSLGFAVGPFRVLEDPEYINSLMEEEGAESDDEEDGSDDKDVGKTGGKGATGEGIEDDDASMDAMETARANGEGIRQAYFAPAFARKHIHATGSNVSLLPDTTFALIPLSQSQAEICEELDKCVLTSTVGVPHRALSLMRDILALPAFRTVSYTQIWIPNAVHGGATSGTLHCCPEVLCNPFLGGSIIDARLLPPVNHRLPYYQGGRALQFVQARCAVRGWITSAIPLAGRDDVGQGYIHTLIEAFIMSLYERGHGAQGEGGAEGSVYFSKRYSARSGLNSSNLDFLPVQNIEDTDFDEVVGGLIGSIPVEDRNIEQLWRSASNGTESHTSAMDEFAVRQLLTIDAVSALERGSEGGKALPPPSMGWMGSSLSLSFLSSNANSSSDLGCGALELMHPVGGLPYRALKGDLLRRVVEGRAGISNFVRLVRATFVAAHLADLEMKELKYPPGKKPRTSDVSKAQGTEKKAENEVVERPKPRFIICVNEILRKRGLSHTLFTRALQNLSGRTREALLLGTLVDVERDMKDPRTGKAFVDPEGFPNSFVRGASELYLRVGVFVEPAMSTSGANVVKGVQLQSYAEPVIPEGGIAYGGPITLRVVENQGQLQEVAKDLTADGSRRDWGSLTLHAPVVTDPKTQTAASGSVESDETSTSTKKDSDATKKSAAGTAKRSLLGLSGLTARAFTETNVHKNGYQALELARITNLTPLLWIRVDPMSLYGGKISVFQPDACIAEMLFHDGDSGAQVEALRALAERPVKVQGSVKVTSVHDVDVKELPVRVLGDCLRGSPALHSDLPHTPAVRAQAALAIAQWQNNKAPKHRTDMGQSSWLGMDLLIQYFSERFWNVGAVMPVKFSRVTVKKNGTETGQGAASDGGNQAMKAIEDDGVRYLDEFEEGIERAVAIEEADQVDVEEDEEYRVRSAVVSAVACIRAKDGMTPPGALTFLETVLQSVDAEMVGGHLVSPDEEVLMEKKMRKVNRKKLEDGNDGSEIAVGDVVVSSLPYASSMLVADTLLALCHVNVSPSFFIDPTTGKAVQSTARHPISKLLEMSRRWLDWELYRERIRWQIEAQLLTGVSGICYDSIAACAITALSSLSILRQSTTDEAIKPSNDADGKEAKRQKRLEEVATADFYIEIFDSKPYRSDVTRAACAQAVACVCCAVDRFEDPLRKPVGLLTALEFLLTRITDTNTTPGLRQTLAQLMLDSCTGKVALVQRVGIVGGRNDAVTSAARLLNGPLGASYGSDVGASVVNTVSADLCPTASAVNDGARRGLRIVKHAGHPRERVDQVTLVRIASFASNLWRTINGEPFKLQNSVPGCFNGAIGVCANDSQLRCTLLALWQWLWPKGCTAVFQVQGRDPSEWPKELVVDGVMKTSEEEKHATGQEESGLSPLRNRVTMELDRQMWRGEMSTEAHDIFKSTHKPSAVLDHSAKEKGIGEPLPPIERDKAFKHGGWVASAAQQRRAKNLDGGIAVTKVRLRKSGD